MARSKRFAARPHRRPPQKLVDSDKLALVFLPFSCYNGQTGGKNGKYALSKTRAVGARRKQTMNYEESRAYIRTAELKKGIVLGLENMRELMRRLGNPQDELK